MGFRDEYQALVYQQLSSQLQAQQQRGLGAMASGVMGGLTAATTTDSATIRNNGTEAEQWYSQQFQPIQYLSPTFQQPNRRTFKFHRVNRVVEVGEAETIENLEPLDELRIKVAKWLYN